MFHVKHARGVACGYFGLCAISVAVWWVCCMGFAWVGAEGYPDLRYVITNFHFPFVLVRFELNNAPTSLYVCDLQH